MGSRRAVPTVLDVTAIVAATLAIGWYSRAFRGTPKGYDAPGHLAKVHLLISQYPHVNWNAAWYSGSPSFAGSYPPGYHALVASLAEVLHLSVGHSILAVAAISLLMIVLGLYGLVRAVTRSRLGALVAVALVLGGPTQWGQILQDGLYPRLLGMGFAAIALALAPGFARRSTPRRLAVVALVLALAGTVHPLAGLLGGILVAALVLVLAPKKWRAFRDVGVLGLGTLALAGFFYVPYFLGSRPHSLFDPSLQPVPWHSLLWPFGDNLAALSPALLVATAAALPLSLLIFGRARLVSRGLGTAVAETRPLLLEGQASRLVAREARSALWTALLLGAAGTAATLYCVAGHFDPHFEYLQELDPATLLTYPEWVLAAACGIALGAAATSGVLTLPRSAHVLAALIGAASLAGVAVLTPILPNGVVDFQGPGLTAVDRAATQGIPQQQQYRIVAADPLAAEALNAVTTTPQTGGYEDQAELGTQWQYWLSVATAEPSWNGNERLFLLDWYAGKWVLVPTGPEEQAYQSDPTHYTLQSTNAYVSAFRVRSASAVAALSNAPTALFVGDMTHYDLFLQALAESDIDSQRLIPLYGGPSVSGLSTSQLASAGSVVLYGASDPNAAAANAELRSYVAHGGRLVIEQGDEGTSSPLPDSVSSLLPTRRTADKVIGSGWRFSAASNGLVDQAQWRKFSPPNYASTGTWQVVVGEGLQPDASVILRAHGAVVVAERRVGSGVVIWTGLNLPYHVAVYKNATESAFLGRLVGAAARGIPSVTASYVVAAEQVKATGVANGLIVKESRTADWRATIDGRPAPIEMAGPGMMYVPLAQAHDVTVVLSYHFSRVELGGIALSLLAVVALFAVLIFGKVPMLGRRLALVRARPPNRRDLSGVGKSPGRAIAALRGRTGGGSHSRQ